jgi:hypothetical protein
VFGEYDPDYIEKFYRFTGDDGRRYRLGDLTNPNKNRPNLTYEFLGVTRVWRWTRDRMERANNAGLIFQSKPGAVPAYKRYLYEMQGQPVTDNWDDIEHLHGGSGESLGYPTQKPLALLERIITIKELFDGKKPAIPLVDTAAFKKAPAEPRGKQDRLLIAEKASFFRSWRSAERA